MNSRIQQLIEASGLCPPRGVEIYRQPRVQGATGLGSSVMYRAIADGTFPPSISLGDRSVGWVSVEVLLRSQAVMAGLNDGEMRELVTWMVEQRTAAIAA